MADPPVKIVRAIKSATDPLIDSSDIGPFFAKLLYEFWGYVVNGGNDPTIHGGIPSGGITAAAGFESGSVIQTGTDGNTEFGDPTFRSNATNFKTLDETEGLKDKYLVMWVSGSSSDDDGIYRILSYKEDNEFALQLDVNSGGIPRLGNKPAFRTRSGIRWRIVDISETSQLSYGSTLSMVMTFEGAADVNPGQASSQAQFVLRTNMTDAGLVVSPSGSWNGSTFTDGTTEVIRDWFTFTSGFCVFYLAGGKDFLMAHLNGIDGALMTGNCGMHIEIPQRLYPANNDPNPIAFMIWENNTPDQTTSTADLATYYNGFFMVGHDDVLREWEVLTRAPHGDRTNTNFSPTNSGIWENFGFGERFSEMIYNKHTNQLLSSDGLLYQSTASQFSLARCRLRRVRFTSNSRSRGTRWGTLWVFADNGILWPWNGSIHPFGPFWEGF